MRQVILAIILFVCVGNVISAEFTMGDLLAKHPSATENVIKEFLEVASDEDEDFDPVYQLETVVFHKGVSETVKRHALNILRRDFGETKEKEVIRYVEISKKAWKKLRKKHKKQAKRNKKKLRNLARINRSRKQRAQKAQQVIAREINIMKRARNTRTISLKLRTILIRAQFITAQQFRQVSEVVFCSSNHNIANTYALITLKARNKSALETLRSFRLSPINQRNRRQVNFRKKALANIQKAIAFCQK